jgi:hypothetical protein
MKYILMALAMLAAQAQARTGTEIRVVNELNQPIAGAEILVGNAPNDPFPDNLFKTDLNGVLQIPIEWKMALPITIEATEYLRTTFINVMPGETTFQLHRKDSHNLLEIAGQTSHFEGIKKDGKIDFGLVFPALSRRQLLQFDVTSMISPEVDTIRVMTESIDIPSNVTLPEQRETYILPIKFDKPLYRMFVKQPGDYRMVAAHGQFPLKEVVKDLRDGKSFFDVLNYFTLLSGGQRDVQVTGSISGQDIAVNKVPFNSTVSVTGPALAGTDVMVSIPMTDQGGVFFPSDIKNIKSGQTVSLRVPSAPSNGAFIASLMMPASEAAQFPPAFSVEEKLTESLKRLLNPKEFAASEGGMSLTMLPATPGLVPEFMSLIPRPTIQGDRISFSRPVAGPSIRPVATYVILAEIEKPPKGKFGAEKRFRLWEVFAEGWVTEIDLPKLFNNVQPGKTYRWEVLFLGADATKTRPLNGYFLDDVSYLSRNSLDF